MAQISLNSGTLSHFAAEGADVQGQIDLDRLSDVTVTNLLSGQILRYDGIQSQWVNTFTGSITALENLSDVTITGIVDGQVIAYNSATSQWENTTGGTGDVTLNGIQTLTNKTLTTPVINEIKYMANTGSGNNFKSLKIINEFDSSLTPNWTSFNGSFHLQNFTRASSDAINVIQFQTPNQKNIFRMDAYNNNPVDGNGNITNKNFTAGNFVTGKTYKIVSVGTTDFTTIGSADNNVNTLFIATGAGTGTGTADLWDTGAQNVLFSLKGGDDIGFEPADNNGLVVGVKYKIWYVGTTDFTAVGSANNTVGTEFTCNATGSTGTGIAVDMRPYKGVWNQFAANTGSQTSPGWQTNLEFRANKIRFHNAYVFPTSDGTANQVLTTDGNDQLSWADSTVALVDGGTY